MSAVSAGFPEGTRFIVSRPFTTELGDHHPGETFSIKDADKFNWDVQLFVRAGLLYPYAPGNGYDYLPPHLFSLVGTKEQAEDFLKGDESLIVLSPNPMSEDEKPELVKETERNAALQELAYAQMRDKQSAGARTDARKAALKAQEELTPSDEIKDNKVEKPRQQAAQQTAARKSQEDEKAAEIQKRRTAAKKTSQPQKKDK